MKESAPKPDSASTKVNCETLAESSEMLVDSIVLSNVQIVLAFCQSVDLSVSYCCFHVYNVCMSIGIVCCNILFDYVYNHI